MADETLLPISLRDTEIELSIRHAGTGCIRDPFGPTCQRGATIESKAGPYKITAGVLLKTEEVGPTAQAHFVVAQHSSALAKRKQDDRALPAGDDSLKTPACRDDGAETSEAIGQHCATGCKNLFTQVQTSSELKPKAGGVMALIGCLASLREMVIEKEFCSPIPGLLYHQCDLPQGRHHPSGSFPAATSLITLGHAQVKLSMKEEIPVLAWAIR